MNAERFTRKSLEAVEGAQRCAMEYSNQEVTSEHLLYSVMTVDDSLIRKLLEKMGIPYDPKKKYQGLNGKDLGQPMCPSCIKSV